MRRRLQFYIQVHSPRTLSKLYIFILIEVHIRFRFSLRCMFIVHCRLWKGYFCRFDQSIIPPVPAIQFY